MDGRERFWKTRQITLHIQGVSLNMPLIIEVVDTQAKLEPLLPELKRVVGDDGLVSISDVYVI